MNKRFFAMLMALAMLVSMVPMTALGATTCYHTNGSHFASKNNGTHVETCNECLTEIAPWANTCYDESPKDGICDGCGYNMGAANCVHDEENFRRNNDGTHTYICSKCTTPGKTETCNLSSGQCWCGNLCTHAVYADGFCTVCGTIDPNYVPPQPECDHVKGDYVSNGEGKHTAKCECGKESHTKTCQDKDGDNLCDVCKYEFPAVEPECDHELGEYESNDEGKHTASCECGKTTHTGDCADNGEGVCGTCGYEFPAVEPECDHELGEYESNGEGKHTASCECGKTTHTGDCADNGEGVCGTCGYEFPAVEPECDHELGEYESNGEGKHTASCECGKTTHTGDCADNGEGVCDTCGYKFPAPEVECIHKLGDYESDGEGKHTAKCGCGNITHTGTCTDNGEGVCDTCGYEFTVCDHEGGAWTSNGDGTHTSECECGEYVDGPHPCYDLGEGVCYMCGYEFPVEESPCDHAWKGVTYRDETSHTVVCRDCQETLYIETHVYENNMPCACGAIYQRHVHTWYEATVIEATCKRAGKIIWKCNGCDESYTEAVAKNPDNHAKLVKLYAAKAGCERGGREIWCCYDCREYIVNETEATGHNYKVTKETSRYTMYTCWSCGHSYKEDKAPETNDRPANGGQNWPFFGFHNFFRK